MSKSSSYLVQNLGKETLVIQGSVSQANVVAFVSELTEKPFSLGQRVRLDLTDAFFEDGLAVLVTVNTLRSLSLRVDDLLLLEPPEALYEGLQGNGALTACPSLRVEMTETEA